MTVSAFKFLQGIPAARPSAHQERTVHKTLLSAVAAAGLLVSAGHAAAQDSGSVDIVTNVTAYCQAVVNPSAPIVVSPIDTRLIGPYDDSDVGRLKIPTPMMLPMISAMAVPRPKRGPVSVAVAVSAEDALVGVVLTCSPPAPSGCRA